MIKDYMDASIDNTVELNSIIIPICVDTVMCFLPNRPLFSCFKSFIREFQKRGYIKLGSLIPFVSNKKNIYALCCKDVFNKRLETEQIKDIVNTLSWRPGGIAVLLQGVEDTICTANISKAFEDCQLTAYIYK